MSYDLFIYSYSSESVLKEKLKEKLASQGWSIACLSPDAFQGTVSMPILPLQGPMEFNLTLIGWKTKRKQARVIERLVAQFDVKGLEKLPRSLFGGCALYITTPYCWADDFGDEDPTELEDTWGQAKLEARKKARTHYSLTVHGAQGQVSFDLQDAVWRAIGELQGGLLENPQSDDVEIYEPDGAQGYRILHRNKPKDHTRAATGAFIFAIGGCLAAILAFRLLTGSNPIIVWSGVGFAFVLGGLLCARIYRFARFLKEIGIFG